MLYAGIGNTATEGMEIPEVLAEFDLQKCFPDLVNTPGFTRPATHNRSVLALWTDRTGQVSASEALATAMEENDAQAAVAGIVADHGQDSPKYYFLEAEFNSLGYRYVVDERYDLAIAVFKATVDMFPDSWNAYDSLGEAFMKDGQKESAIRNYETSMELNPENENGRTMLAEIRGMTGTN